MHGALGKAPLAAIGTALAAPINTTIINRNAGLVLANDQPREGHRDQCRNRRGVTNENRTSIR
jgi:hypothetical protein